MALPGRDAAGRREPRRDYHGARALPPSMPRPPRRCLPLRLVGLWAGLRDDVRGDRRGVSAGRTPPRQAGRGPCCHRARQDRPGILALMLRGSRKARRCVSFALRLLSDPSYPAAGTSAYTRVRIHAVGDQARNPPRRSRHARQLRAPRLRAAAGRAKPAEAGAPGSAFCGLVSRDTAGARHRLGVLPAWWSQVLARIEAAAAVMARITACSSAARTGDRLPHNASSLRLLVEARFRLRARRVDAWRQRPGTVMFVQHLLFGRRRRDASTDPMTKRPR